MMKPGQTIEMLAREITQEIERAIDKVVFDDYILNYYDVIEAHILKLLKHPMCPKCGCQKLRGDCGHVWEVL